MGTEGHPMIFTNS